MPHFEIYVADTKRAQTFYGGLFGWSFDTMPMGDGVEYFLISGPGIEGSLTGGMMQRPDETPEPGGPIRGCTLTFEVADCDDRYDWALKNGGAVALPPMDYPGIGRAASVEDGQGNVVGFIAPEEA
ncbi:MAG: VOC family protein [Pseudomonadota bacterium]